MKRLWALVFLALLVAVPFFKARTQTKSKSSRAAITKGTITS
jgi:hypothetical protein